MPLVERVISVLAPHECLVCARQGQLVCVHCRFDAFEALPSRCYRCHALSSDFAVCDKCRRSTVLKHVWVRTNYGAVAKELIHRYKFDHARSASGVIAEALDEIMPYIPADTLVVPVPTATDRRRARGFDHTLLLARSLAHNRQREYIQPIVRLTHTRQVGASRKQRFEQLQNAFFVTRPEQVRGKDVLLIDDIVTSGATLEAVGSLLKQAGARRVDALVFAQKK